MRRERAPVPGHGATAASQRLARHHLERKESYKEGGRTLRPEPGIQAEIPGARSLGTTASPQSDELHRHYCPSSQPQRIQGPGLLCHLTLSSGGRGHSPLPPRPQHTSEGALGSCGHSQLGLGNPTRGMCVGGECREMKGKGTAECLKV